MPEPVLRYEPHDMWLEFAFGQAYLKAAGRGQAEQVTPYVTPYVVRMLEGVIGEMGRAELITTYAKIHR